MGKKAKEHRAKVAKRNAKIQQQKSAMQKAFDSLLKSQMDEMINNENTTVSLSGQSFGFEVLNESVVEDGITLSIDPEKSQQINKEFEEELPTEE
jgi:hypothetical protein